MRTNRFNNLKLVLFILLTVILNLNSLFAQAPKKTISAPKKQTVQISSLNAKLSIDTSGIIFPNNGASDFSIVYAKEGSGGFGFRMNFNSGIQIYEMEEFEDYKEFNKNEVLTTIGKIPYLIGHSDSSTIKIKDLKYWYTKETIRPVPKFYSEMKNQIKLNSSDMTTFLNSDNESWQKSENYLKFITLNKFTNRPIIISVRYFYEDSPRVKDIETKAKEIISGLVFLPVQQGK